MTAALDGSRLIDDPAYFAEVAIGEPLWDYQADFARSPARYRVMCSGRQVGKSRLLAVCALHKAYTQANASVLIISNGEDSSKRVVADCHYLTGRSAILKGSRMDEFTSSLTLTNGSTIQSIPASDARARGNSVDLLIVDEAGFIKESLWQAAEPSILARPGSRVILASTPWGTYQHFFRRKFNEGKNAPSERVRSWNWPSAQSPIHDETLIEQWRQEWSPIKFQTEILAEWVDETGAYFTMGEIDNAIADYELVKPSESDGHYVVGGIDWGFSDANCVVFLAALNDPELNRERQGDRPVFYIPWLEAEYKMPYTQFIERLVDHAKSFSVARYISETNGVGQYPTQRLHERIDATPRGYYNPFYGNGMSGGLQTNTWVHGVHTDNRRKSSGFGRIKGLLQEGRLVLPRNADLMRQLHSLTYEQSPLGDYKISVPDNVGHDDLAMALLQAVSCIWHHRDAYFDGGHLGSGPIIETGNGTRLHTHPGTISDFSLFGSGPKSV